MANDSGAFDVQVTVVDSLGGTNTNSKTLTYHVSGVALPTPTPTATVLSPTPTLTNTAVATTTPSNTLVPSTTLTHTLVPTDTPTTTPSVTSTSTATATATLAATPSVTPVTYVDGDEHTDGQLRRHHDSVAGTDVYHHTDAAASSNALDTNGNVWWHGHTGAVGRRWLSDQRTVAKRRALVLLIPLAVLAWYRSRPW